MDDGLTEPGPSGVVLPGESHSGFQHPPAVGFVGLEDRAISDVLEVTDGGMNPIVASSVLPQWGSWVLKTVPSLTSWR